MPPAFITVGRSPVAGMAHLRVAGLLIAIVLLYYTEHTPFGRQMHAVGDSERVAFLAGIRTSRIKTLRPGRADGRHRRDLPVRLRRRRRPRFRAGGRRK